MAEFKRCITIYPPMLDIIVHATEDFLESRGVEVNTIVGYSEKKHKKIFKEMLQRIEKKDKTISFLAGGATFNTQKILSRWMECIFFGIIGEDLYGSILEEQMQKRSMQIHLDKSKHASTQWAYVFLSGDKRTLIAKQDPGLKYSPEMQKKITASFGENAIFYFVSFTFFLKNIAEEALRVMTLRRSADLLTIINLSSKEIVKMFRKQILTAIKSADFLIGNRSEFYALFDGVQEEELLLEWLDVLAISYAITDGPCESVGRISNGPIRRITPPAISLEINTNGAGDSFAAGFIGALRSKEFIKTRDILPLLQAGTHTSFEYILHNRHASQE